VKLASVPAPSLEQTKAVDPPSKDRSIFRVAANVPDAEMLRFAHAIVRMDGLNQLDVPVSVKVPVTGSDMEFLQRSAQRKPRQKTGLD
jgi:hypothetical protein